MGGYVGGWVGVRVHVCTYARVFGLLVHDGQDNNAINGGYMIICMHCGFICYPQFCSDMVCTPSLQWPCL